jgi:cysteine synthase
MHGLERLQLESHDSLSAGCIKPKCNIFQSPLREIEQGLLMKFELDLPGSSHKVRAARHIVQSALKIGAIVPGQTTVIEKTGGNFGLGLILACKEINVPVELAVGLSFSPVKRRCLESFGARLIGIEQLQNKVTPREVVEWYLAHADQLGKSYFYTDQFNNPGSLQAHETETGPEIAAQIALSFPEVKSIHLVTCAGTGAHLTGIARALMRAGYQLETTLVEPEGCDSRAGVFIEHRIEGMAVGVKPPLLDWSLVNETVTIDHHTMLLAQSQLVTQHGYFVGYTSAACYAIAERATRNGIQRRDHKVLTLAYDHGLWYH